MSVGSLPRKEVNSPEAEVYPCGFLVPPRSMTTTIIPDCDEPDLSPLVFHIRALRQWHCHGGLPQATLAELAGLSRHQLHRLEQSRELPAALVQILAVAYALGVEPESLIDPRVRERIREAVTKRREDCRAAGRYAVD